MLSGFLSFVGFLCALALIPVAAILTVALLFFLVPILLVVILGIVLAPFLLVFGIVVAVVEGLGNLFP